MSAIIALMKRASITEAKNRLSALLDRVRHGETIVIEDRGIPIAQMSPVTGRAAISDRDRLRRLERHGIIRPAVPAPLGRLLDTAPPRPGRPVALSQLVREERAGTW